MREDKDVSDCVYGCSANPFNDGCDSLTNTKVHKSHTLKKETAASGIWIRSDLDSRAVKGWNC